jgi:hypothetical protein
MTQYAAENFFHVFLGKDKQKNNSKCVNKVKALGGCGGGGAAIVYVTPAPVISITCELKLVAW